MDHAMTIRLPERVWRAARKMAERRNISLNRLVQEALVQEAAAALQERLHCAYDTLAGDDDLEDLLAVQAAALLDD